MKSTKTILMAGILSLAIGSLANATTVVRFTGSTAFRANTQKAIVHTFDSLPLAAGLSDINGSGDSIFSGNIGGNPVIVKCHWTGSEAGVQAVAKPTVTVSFLPDSAVATATQITNGSTYAGFHTLTSGDLSTYPNVNESANVALADAWQASSAYYGVSKGYATLTGGNSYAGGVVGVVTFKWLASPNATITDITGKQAQVLYSSGYLPQSQFTGNTADDSKYIYAIGRDSGSGTRLTMVTEIGFGSLQNCVQYDPQTAANAEVSGTGVTIDHMAILSGTAGYASGGPLVKAIANTGPVDTVNGGNVTIVGYAGQTDADGAGQGIAAGAKELSYNGVLLGSMSVDANVQKIIEGKYTFWGYEHLYYNGLTGISKTVADNVAKQIREGSASAQAAPLDAPRPYLGEMKVSRSTDGAPCLQSGLIPDNSPY